MKIAILSSFYPYRGGIAQFNASLYGSLSRSHDVKAFNFKRQYPDLLFPGKTQYVTPDDAAVPVETESILDTVAPHTYVRTARAVRDWGADLLVMKYWMSWFAPSLGWVARHAGDRCKVVPVLDNVIPHEAHWFDKPLSRYFLKGCDGFVTMSGSVTDDLLYLVPDARYVLLPHPLYSHFGEKMDRKDAEDRLGLQPGMKNLLFFGLIRDYKGLDILLDAFRDLPEDYQLIIAGEPYGSFDKYRAQIDGIPGRDRIHVFPEYVKDAEVGKFFSAADVTVLPYRNATQSGISSVSYHFEVPMIVTDVGGLKGTIGDHGTGIVAPSATPAAIRQEILRYFADSRIREDSIAAIRREKQRLSWDRFAADLVQFAEQL